MSGPLRKTVDDQELPNFFESVRAVHAAGRRYVDQVEKEKEKSNGTHKAQA